MPIRSIYFYSVHLRVKTCMYAYASHVCLCIWRAEEDIQTPGAGFTSVVNQPTWALPGQHVL